MKPSGKRIANIKPSFLLVKDIKLGHNVIWFFHTALIICYNLASKNHTHLSFRRRASITRFRI